MATLDCVGKLYRWDPLTKQATGPHAISAFHPLLVGRNRRSCQYVFDDACVSNQHLRIYTVIYDLENPLNIAPLVYAQDISTNGTFWNGQRIDRRNGGAVLLSDGDILRLSSKTFLEFRSEYQSARPLNNTQEKEIKEFSKEYLISDRMLGEGGFGQVRMAVNLDTTSQVACKIVNLCAVKEIPPRREDDHGTNLLELQKREVAILQKLCHPNIIGVEKVFMMESSLYIFEDLITAGDLFTFVESKGGSITDFEAASVIQQILIAVDYLHENNIVHRDLKPENILMTSHGVKRRIVLADFGCAQVVSPGTKRMSTVVGTWDYTAPEIYNQVKAGYTKSVDLWSVGCIAVVLLTGTPPFPYSASSNIEYNEPGDLNEMFMNHRWSEASKMAQSFVLSLLVLDERKRLTVKQALQHPWFVNEQYQSKLRQLYEEAIRDWQPRSDIVPSNSENCFQFLHKDLDKAPGTALTPTMEPHKYRIIRSVSEKRIANETARNDKFVEASYPRRGLYMHERATRDKICVYQFSTPSSNTCPSFSPQAWKTTPSIRKLASTSNKPGLNQLNFDVGTPKRPKAELTTGHESWAYTSGKLTGKFHMPAGIAVVASKSITSITGAKRSFDETHSQSPEIGEVYEEVENKITGRVQRIPYQEK